MVFNIITITITIFLISLILFVSYIIGGFLIDLLLWLYSGFTYFYKVIKDDTNKNNKSNKNESKINPYKKKNTTISKDLKIKEDNNPALFISLPNFYKKYSLFFVELSIGYFIIVAFAYALSFLLRNVRLGSKLSLIILIIFAIVYIFLKRYFNLFNTKKIKQIIFNNYWSLDNKKLKKDKKKTSERIRSKSNLVDFIIIISIIIFSVIFIYTIYLYPVHNKNNNRSYILFWYAWADGSYHSALAQSFYYSNNIPPVSPIHPMSRLMYPPVADYNIAFFESIGIDYISAFRFAEMFVLSVFLLNSYLIIYMLFKKRIFGIIAILIILLFSPLNYYLNCYYIKGSNMFYQKNLGINVNSNRLSITNNVPLWSYIYEVFYHSMIHPISDPSRDRYHDVVMSNFVSHILLPQRTFIYGISFLSALLFLILGFFKDNIKIRKLRSYFKSYLIEFNNILKIIKTKKYYEKNNMNKLKKYKKENKIKTSQILKDKGHNNMNEYDFMPTNVYLKYVSFYFIIGLLIGLLSLYHFHIFVFISGVFFLLFLFFSNESFFWVLLGIFISSLPQIFLILTSVTSHHFIKFSPLLNQHFISITDFMLWFFLSANVFYILLTSISIFLIKKEYKIIYMSLLIIVSFSFVIIFQPNTFDNNKFWYLLFYLLIPFFLLILKKSKTPLQRTLIITYIILMLFPGIPSYIWMYNQRYSITNDQLINLTSIVSSQIPGKSIFIGSLSSTEPIMVTGGKLMFTSYGGWEWAHGFSYIKRENIVNKLFKAYKNGMSKEDICNLLTKNKIDYIVFGNSEMYDFGKKSFDYINSNFIKVFDSKQYGFKQFLDIYSVKKSCNEY